MNLAMCEVPVHPVQFLSVAELEALPELVMTQDSDGTYYCDGESTQDGTPSPDNPVPIVNTYPADTYKAICGDKTYKVTLDDDLRSVPGVADRVRIDAGKGVCWVERKVVQKYFSEFNNIQFEREKDNTIVFNTTNNIPKPSEKECLCTHFTAQKDGDVPTIKILPEYHATIYFALYKTDASTLEELKTWIAENNPYLLYCITPTTHQSIPTQLTTISSGRSVAIPNTINDAVDMLAVKGDSWQLVQEQGKNLLNPDEIEIGGLSGSVGENFTTSTRIRIGFIPVEEGKKYVFSGHNYIFENTHVYDSSKSRIGNFYNGKEIVSGGKYVRVSFKKSTNEDFTEEELQELKSALMFEEGDTATDYEPFQPAMPSPEYPSEIVSVEGEMRSCGWNLFDAEKFVDNYNKNSTLGRISVIDDNSITILQEQYMENVTKIDFGFVNDIVYKFSCDVEWISSTNDDASFNFRFKFRNGQFEFINIHCSSKTAHYETILPRSELQYFMIGNWRYSGEVIIKNIKLQSANRPYDRHRGNSITLPVLRGLPDGTADVMYVDRAAKRAWVERSIKELILDANTIFSQSGKEMSIRLDNYPAANNSSSIICMCSDYEAFSRSVLYGNRNADGFRGISASQKCIRIVDNLLFNGDIVSFKEYVKEKCDAGTPITVYYLLEEPAIEELPYTDYLLQTAQYETNINIDCDEHLEPEISATVKVLGR